MSKQWSHKMNLPPTNLEPELNAYAQQGYEIFKLWKNVDFNNYEIVAYKETIVGDNKANGYDELGNPIR